MKFRVERICRSDSMSAIPLEKVGIDLAASERALKDAGYGVETQELYLTVKIEGFDVTVYPGGRVLIHPMNDKKKAKDLALRLFDLVVIKSDLV